MKISELTLDTVKQFLRVEHTEDDGLIGATLTAATAYALSYTGLTAEEADGLPDLTIALLVLCSEMYENRRASVETDRENPVVRTILGMHSRNLV